MCLKLATIWHPPISASSPVPIRSGLKDEHDDILQCRSSLPGYEISAGIVDQSNKEAIDIRDSTFLSQICFVNTRFHNPLSTPSIFITPRSRPWYRHWPAHHTCLYLQSLLTGSVNSQHIASVQHSSQILSPPFSTTTTRNHGWLLIRTRWRPRCPLRYLAQRWQQRRRQHFS